MVTEALRKRLSDKQWRSQHLSEYRMEKIDRGAAKRTGHTRPQKGRTHQGRK